MKTARMQAVVLDALNPDYHRPQKTNRTGMVVEEELRGKVYMTSAEILDFVNHRMRHGSTPSQLGNVLSKMVYPVVVKIADDVPRKGILSGYYGIAAWCNVNNIVEALEELHGGPDNAWTHVSTVGDGVCAVRKCDRNWFTACGSVLKGLEVEDFCNQNLVTCPDCSQRWD